MRERIWSLLEAEHAVEPGVYGHIPDFVGKDAAAERLAALPAWKDATWSRPALVGQPR